MHYHLWKNLSFNLDSSILTLVCAMRLIDFADVFKNFVLVSAKLCGTTKRDCFLVNDEINRCSIICLVMMVLVQFSLCAQPRSCINGFENSIFGRHFCARLFCTVRERTRARRYCVQKNVFYCRVGCFFLELHFFKLYSIS